MYSVQFAGFRCFGRMEPVKMRPLTFLIGENSTGKTSFLAELRYVLEAARTEPERAFNRDPFSLGGFDQIVRQTSGRSKRIEAFKMMIRADSARTRREEPSGPVTQTYGLTRGTPQPEVRSLEILTNAGGIRVTRTSTSIDGVLIAPDKSEHPLKGHFTRIPPYRLAMPLALVAEDILRFGIADRPGDDRRLDRLAQQLRTMAGNIRNALSEWLYGPRRLRGLFGAGDTYAFAPVRSEPQRTYTPSELVTSSQGGHVPLALARAKSRASDQWDGIRDSLNAFGKAAGLFSDIDVRHFGKSDTDPFQILLKINGPSVNLADVGYGVNQILPVLYQLQTSSTGDTFLLQQPEVHLHPRAQAELGSLFARIVATGNSIGAKSRRTFVIETHSDYLVDRARIDVAEGRLSPDDITILFFERGKHEVTVRNLFLNDNGEILDPPPNYRSFFLREHARLLGL